MTTLTEQEALALQIISEINTMEVVRPGDLTIRELEKKTGKPRTWLVRHMESRADIEIIKNAYDPVTQRNVTAYRPKVV